MGNFSVHLTSHGLCCAGDYLVLVLEPTRVEGHLNAQRNAALTQFFELRQLFACDTCSDLYEALFRGYRSATTPDTRIEPSPPLLFWSVARRCACARAALGSSLFMRLALCLRLLASSLYRPPTAAFLDFEQLVMASAQTTSAGRVRAAQGAAGWVKLLRRRSVSS